MSGLAQEEVDRQIQQMVAFIEQEAKEKADEISVKAEEEFNIEKGRLVQQEKLKLMQQFERKEKQADTAKKIAYSMSLNVARLEVLKAQEDHLKSVVAKAESNLGDLAKDKSKYKKLVEDLIAQGLCTLLEESVTLKCCKGDVALVKEVLPAALKKFTAQSGMKCNCEIDTKAESVLPDSCGGGVLLCNSNGRITVNNTLEARLELAIQQLLPAIRHKLFGASEGRTFFD